MQYGIVAGSPTHPGIRYGVPCRASVWAAGHAVLSAAVPYKPIWECDKTLAMDLSAHLGRRRRHGHGLRAAVAVERHRGLTNTDSANEAAHRLRKMS